MEQSHHSAPVTIQLTERVLNAARQDEVSLRIDSDDLAFVLRETGRSADFADGATVFIHAPRPFDSDRPDQPQFSASNTEEAVRVQQVDPKDRSVIKLAVDTRFPITADVLAQQTAEALLRPARWRNTLRTAAGILLKTSGVLFAGTAFSKYMAETDHTPGTWALAVGGGLALVAGGVTLSQAHRRHQQLNITEQRAAQYNPIAIVPNEFANYRPPSGA
jgi:hypothetical protein